MRATAKPLNVLLLTAGVLACAGTAGPALPGPAAECVLGGAAPGEALTVAVAEAPDAAHAPAPRTAAERLIFRQLYETLVRIDCSGNLLPGLAESWTPEEQGRAWRFRLRPAATFTDGSAVTAHAVVESWSAPGRTGERIAAAFAGVTALGQRELRIELRAPAPLPLLFAHPDFAVARPVPDSPWPLGSGPFRIDSSDAARFVRFARRTPGADAPVSIAFRVFPGADPRAPLDARADVLVTADPLVVAYARALTGYTVTALPWNRTYVLATSAPPQDALADTLMGPPADALLALARDAVPAGTRVAAPPFWWHDPACRPALPRPRTRAPARANARTIVYPRRDAVARGVAERLVALAWPAARMPPWLRALLPRDYAAAGPPVAAGLDDPVLADSLRGGRALAFVVPLPRSPGGRCAAVSASDGIAADLLTAPTAWRITPLLDAHDFLVHRGDAGGILVEGDGTLVFAGGRP